MGCRGGRSIKRLQLLMKALCHHCSDDPLACPYVDGHLSGETLRQLELQLSIRTPPNSLSVVCIISVSHPVFVTHFVMIPYGIMR